MEIGVHEISKRFGGLQAVEQVSLMARSGEVTSVIGPNGAGKTTLLNCISGLIPPDTGHIRIGDARHERFGPQHLLDIGITRTFQNIRLWENLTIEEHVLLARQRFLASSRARPAHRSETPRQTAGRLLDRVDLSGKAHLYPQELSYGERRRLEIARGLATEPVLLLLDEPAAGFTLSEQNRLAALVSELAKGGIAIILVEHHMDLVARVSTRVVVLNFGRHLMTGTIEEVRRSPEVISAYLGVEA
jgi:branched-chain amino acid transport system ATP-binding protein